MTLTPQIKIHNDVKELRLLFEVSRLLIEAGKPLDERLREVLAVLARYTGLMRGFIALTRAERLEVIFEAGSGREAPGGRPLGQGAVGLAAETDRS